MAEVTGLKAPAPLSTEHDTTDFDCGSPPLNDWLRQRTLKTESRFSRTYAVSDGCRVIAYYSLSAGSIERMATPGKLRRNAPDAIAISVIGRLAVDRAYADGSRSLFLPIETVIAGMG